MKRHIVALDTGERPKGRCHWDCPAPCAGGAVFIAFAVVALSLSLFADQIRLRDGSVKEGEVVFQDASKITLRQKLPDNIIAERDILRNEIVEIVKDTEDTVAYGKLPVLALNHPFSHPLDRYNTIISNHYIPFLTRFPGSVMASNIQQRLLETTRERDEVAAGKVKFNGKWHSEKQVKRRSLDFQAYNSFVGISQARVASDFTRVMSQWEAFENGFFGTIFTPNALDETILALAERDKAVARQLREARDAQAVHESKILAARERLDAIKPREHIVQDKLKRWTTDSWGRRIEVTPAVTNYGHTASEQIDINQAKRDIENHSLSHQQAVKIEEQTRALQERFSSKLASLRELRSASDFAKSISLAEKAESLLDGGLLSEAEAAIENAARAWSANLLVKQLRSELIAAKAAEKSRQLAATVSSAGQATEGTTPPATLSKNQETMASSPPSTPPPRSPTIVPLNDLPAKKADADEKPPPPTDAPATSDAWPMWWIIGAAGFGAAIATMILRRRSRAAPQPPMDPALARHPSQQAAAEPPPEPSRLRLKTATPSDAREAGSMAPRKRFLYVDPRSGAAQNSQPADVPPRLDGGGLTGKMLGDYEMENELGRGAMGVVYRARQTSLDRPVAVKVLPPELCANRDYVERFLREARAAARLNHPNVVQIHDVGVQDGIHFFVMEFVEGRTLGQMLRETGRFHEREALRLVREAARGLGFAHDRGIVHRDVKPENMMLTSYGTLKISDLGLAKWKSEEDANSLTMTGVTMGTPYYMSPEQIRAVKDIDPRTDVYSLGMTLYHLLAGRPAFAKGSAAEIMAQHLADAPPSLRQINPQISDATARLVERMIAKEREERIPNMTEVTREITGILGDG